MMKALLVAATLLAVTPATAWDVRDGIRLDCAQANAFSLEKREACIKTATYEYQQFLTWPFTLKTTQEREIIEGCKTKWRTENGHDWPMINYCIDKALK